MVTYEARNRFGALVRTFGSKEQGERFVSDMAAIGSPFTLVRVVLSRRAA